MINLTQKLKNVRNKFFDRNIIRVKKILHNNYIWENKNNYNDFNVNQ